MTDRKKVIKGLKFCSTGMCFDGCPYHEVSQNIDKCTSQLALEALELLKEQEPVRCKDCAHRGNKNKCIVAFVADKQDFPVFFYDNHGKWFCADGKPKEV